MSTLYRVLGPILVLLCFANVVSFAQIAPGDMVHTNVPVGAKDANRGGGQLPANINIAFPNGQKVFPVGGSSILSIKVYAVPAANCTVEISSTSTENPAVVPTFQKTTLTVIGKGFTLAATDTLTVNMPTDIGNANITATITAIDGTPLNNPKPSASITVTVCKLKELTVKYALPDQCVENTPQLSTCYVGAADGKTEVIITAVLDPIIPDADTQGIVTWNTGTKQGNLSTKVLRQLVNANNLEEKRTITATCGSSSISIHFHIVKVPINVGLTLNPLANYKAPPTDPVNGLQALGETSFKYTDGAMENRSTGAYLYNNAGKYEWKFYIKEISFNYNIGTSKAGKIEVAARAKDDGNIYSTDIVFPIFNVATGLPKLEKSFNFVSGTDIVYHDGKTISIGYGDIKPGYGNNELYDKIQDPLHYNAISITDPERYVKSVQRAFTMYIVDGFTRAHEDLHAKQFANVTKSWIDKYNTEIYSKISVPYRCDTTGTSVAAIGAAAPGGGTIWDVTVTGTDTIANPPVTVNAAAIEWLRLYYIQAFRECVTKKSLFEYDAYKKSYDLYNQKLTIRK